MDIFSVFSAFGGLALFLYGMTVLSNGLEKLAGGKMEQVLRRLTSNRVKGLLLGAGVTAVIQSSSAVTVMLVGMVNSGIMQLGQAISITMGSNVGTTATAWILGLTGIDSDAVWIQMLKPSNFSPLVALIGVIMMMAGKRQYQKDVGTILVGFAVLMYGMDILSGAMKPLADVPEFRQLLIAFSNPILGVLVGMIFTAIIQSSSASVGVLQALALTGSVSFGTAIPIIMGQNIGTCVSSLLASIGTNRSARRVAVVHLLFNVIGTVVGLILWCSLDALFQFAFASEAAAPFDIAILHSIFNIGATILLLPCINLLEKAACRIIPDDQQQEKTVLLDDRLLTVPAFAVAKSVNATVKMAELAREAAFSAIDLVEKFNDKVATQVIDLEQQLDNYEDQLGTYLVKLSRCDISEEHSSKISMLLHSIGNFERIGDHALNLHDTAKEMYEKNIVFSVGAQEEISTLTDAIQEILMITTEAYAASDATLSARVEPLEQVIDALIAKIRVHHIDRLQNGTCTIELGFVLADLLNNYERISDHCSNIAVAVIESKSGNFDSHEYLNNLKNAPDGSFADCFHEYQQRYMIKDTL